MFIDFSLIIKVLSFFSSYFLFNYFSSFFSFLRHALLCIKLCLYHSFSRRSSFSFHSARFQYLNNFSSVIFDVVVSVASFCGFYCTFNKIRIGVFSALYFFFFFLCSLIFFPFLFIFFRYLYDPIFEFMVVLCEGFL